MIRVLTNIGELAVCPDRGGQGEIGLIRNAALAWDETSGKIVWAGPSDDRPSLAHSWHGENAQGRVVIPGLIDCHTHLAFAGWRADEFARRCQGASYGEIAAEGGGIARTVAMTRKATEDDLVDRSRRFLREMLALGVTAVECKSGYGLTVEDELKLLNVYCRLRAATSQHLVATFLGAHAVPAEWKSNRDGYLSLLCKSLMPEIAQRKLARFCDVFVDRRAFSIDEARRILTAGIEYGMRPKLHADQLADDGAAGLAAAVGAISADHLEYANDAGLAAMATAGTIAVLLPFATVNVHVPPLDARRCVRAGLAVAVATDFNPGSAPSYHLPFAMSLACALNRLSPAEALKGATINAAKAIGLSSEIGSLEAGKRADFVVLEAESIDHWLYHAKANAATAIYLGGVQIQ